MWKEKNPSKICEAIVNDGASTYPISIWGDLIDIISKLNQFIKELI